MVQPVLSPGEILLSLFHLDNSIRFKLPDGIRYIVNGKKFVDVESPGTNIFRIEVDDMNLMNGDAQPLQ